VAQIHRQIQAQRADGLTNVASGYVPGPGTGSYGTWDGARGHTFEERAETMYRQFIEQSGRWLRENPNADIRVAAIGFSRGAEEAAYFTQLVQDRGIQDPTGARYTTTHDGLVSSVQYTKPPLVAPGQVIQAAGLMDPVATGDPRNYDRRLAEGVVSAFQVTARDETRDQFVGTPHVRPGFSDNNRSLNITVPGAHSDIGDGYGANGLGIRNTNMLSQYLNGLVDNDRPLLRLREEPQGQHRNNVIHDSERHNSWIYTRMGFDRDGVRDVNMQLGAPEYQTVQTGRGSITVQAPPSEAQRQREPMDQNLAGRLEYRPLPIVEPPTPNRADLQPQPTPATPAPRSLLEDGHPGNTIYRQALHGIETSPNIPAGTIQPDQRIPAAMALTASAVEAPDPLKSINAVVMNRNGDRLIAVEGNLANSETCKMASVGLDAARTASARECSERTETALQAAATQPTLGRQPVQQQDEAPKIAARGP
jgi:hypothetical protein